MNVFEFRDRLVGDYSTFSRSFTWVGPDDIRQFLGKGYDSGRYWPVPLIQINPSFQPADTVEELCEAGGSIPSAPGSSASISRRWRTARRYTSIGIRWRRWR